MKTESKPEAEPVIQDPCISCGKTLREQMKGCNVIYCYRQFLKPEPVTGERSAEEILRQLLESWRLYTDFLKQKYPPKEGEDFTFTCQHHAKINSLLLTYARTASK